MPREGSGRTYITTYLSDGLKRYLTETVVKAEVRRTGDAKSGALSSFAVQAYRESIRARINRGYLNPADIPDDAVEIADLKDMKPVKPGNAR